MRRGRRTSSASCAIPDEVVLDASVIVRAAVGPDSDAREWTASVESDAVVGYAPAHVDVEVAHALLRYVRGGTLSPGDAAEALRLSLALPIRREPLEGIVAAAFGAAVAYGLSVYDACYWALAQALDARLVTADRTLAASYERSVLIV